MENKTALVDSFCDLLTDNLIHFEEREKILSRIFDTKVNLVETVAVTLIIEFRKLYLKHDDLSFFVKRHKLGWTDYFASLRWFAKSVFGMVFARSKMKSTSGRVCFFEYYSHNLPISEAIIELLGKDYSYTYVSLRDSVFAKTNNKYPTITSGYYGCVEIRSAFKINKAVDYFTKVFFEEFVLSRCETKFGGFKYLFAYTLKRQLLNILKYRKQYNSIFVSLKPKKAIFTTDSSPNNRLLIQYCKIYKVPSISLQHGLMPESKLLGLMITDYYLVWGEYYKLLLEKYNRSIKAIVVGSLKHEILIDRYFSRAKRRNKILFATSPPSGTLIFKEDYERAFYEVWGAAYKLASYDFYIKLHPSEKSENIDELIRKYGSLPNIHLLSNTDNIYEHISDSMVVLFVGSTVSLEALLFRTPTLSINLGFFDKSLIPYSRVSGYYEVTLTGEISAVILSISENHGVRDEEEIRFFCLPQFVAEKGRKYIF